LIFSNIIGAGKGSTGAISAQDWPVAWAEKNVSVSQGHGIQRAEKNFSVSQGHGFKGESLSDQSGYGLT
jgi:hypothetical protein